jgi:hypothetical protein
MVSLDHPQHHVVNQTEHIAEVDLTQHQPHQVRQQHKHSQPILLIYSSLVVEYQVIAKTLIG